MDRARGTIDAVLEDLSRAIPRAMPNLTPDAQEDALKLLRLTVWHAWRETETGPRPKAWAEKFWSAGSAADRQQIFFAAIKYKALEARRQQTADAQRFVSLDALGAPADDSEGGSVSPAGPAPSVTENHEAGLLKEELHQALLGLPIQLAVIAHLMPLAEGNASKLADRLGIPQRKMSRHLARIREHLRKRGLGS